MVNVHRPPIQAVDGALTHLGVRLVLVYQGTPTVRTHTITLPQLTVGQACPATTTMDLALVSEMSL